MWDASQAIVAIRTSDNQSLLLSGDLNQFDTTSRETLRRLAAQLGGLLDVVETLGQLEARSIEHAGPNGRLFMHAAFAWLADRRMITVSSADGKLVFVPYTAQALHSLLKSAVGPMSLTLSRFALMRPNQLTGEGILLECPRAKGHFEIRDADVAADAARLLAHRRVNLANATDPASSLLIAGFSAGAFLSSVSQNDELPYWEFHDLYFHSRTRLGRHQGPIGGTFRMSDRDPLPPAVKTMPTAQAGISLPRPDLAAIAARDMSLTAAMAARESIRQHAAIPLTLAELGEFLHRSCAVRSIWRTQLGEFTRRPYPSGGGSYDIEVYLIVQRVQGLDAGVYHYEPLSHVLERIDADNETARLMLFDAYYASAQTCYPDILLLLASRYKRVQWKYSGMAYATILKNVGALYATFYLVATAMRLAPCGLGLGDPEKFAKLTGADYYEEGTVGEFMLGRA